MEVCDLDTASTGNKTAEQRLLIASIDNESRLVFGKLFQEDPTKEKSSSLLSGIWNLGGSPSISSDNPCSSPQF
jgi:hypothetical protein